MIPIAIEMSASANSLPNWNSNDKMAVGFSDGHFVFKDKLNHYSKNRLQLSLIRRANTVLSSKFEVRVRPDSDSNSD